MKSLIKHSYQRGMATLVVTIAVLVTATLMVIFATKVGMFDQRMAGNETRHKEAFAIAEAGLDYSTERFITEFKRLYDGTSPTTTTNTLATILANAQATDLRADGTAASAGQAKFSVTVVNSGASLGTIPIFTFTSTGTSADGSGSANVIRQISMANALGGSTPDVPLIVGGSVGTGGNFNIVGNPNGSGPGVPVSIWSGPPSNPPKVIELTSGSAATCHRQYFGGNNPQCGPSYLSHAEMGGVTLTSYSQSYPDLLPNDANFPTDLFRFLFGINKADWTTKKAEADSYGHVVSSCSGLNASSGNTYPLWWITGECQLGPGQVIGSTTKPVILVLDNQALTMNSGTSVIYGIVYIFDNPTIANTTGNPPTPGMKLGGSPMIQGSLISDVGGDQMQGSYSVVYDPDLLSNLGGKNGSSYTAAYIPGSWRDF
ncbi:PilX N-terminal domain-containing pilus assembly protein [Methylomonas montana]|uniref:pilus assembly PilX family protein n=1 Tax=Methylomonas montana TaxID=3058963 RepID=UPI00265878F5|nr:PilX N-terminal domain-containing pilus assembly protein [Methylomonas montana]WKJ92444.1 PilX N-terminal domain-containing pilus assembly protein [Methylomonas montana]